MNINDINPRRTSHAKMRRKIANDKFARIELTMNGCMLVLESIDNRRYNRSFILSIYRLDGARSHRKPWVFDRKVRFKNEHTALQKMEELHATLAAKQ